MLGFNVLVQHSYAVCGVIVLKTCNCYCVISFLKNQLILKFFGHIYGTKYDFPISEGFRFFLLFSPVRFSIFVAS